MDCGAGSGSSNHTGSGTEGAACPSLAKDFREQAQARVECFYADLGRLGEVPPAARLRLEGFLEAGLTLGLVAKDEISRWVDDSYDRHLPTEQHQRAPTAPADSDNNLIVLPVRWRRAPVYPS